MFNRLNPNDFEGYKKAIVIYTFLSTAVVHRITILFYHRVSKKGYGEISFKCLLYLPGSFMLAGKIIAMVQ